MKFKLIDQAKAAFPITRLCRLLGLSPSGYFAWKDRPASRRQQADLVLLAHTRSALALSNGTYGSPRMTRELHDNGFVVGRRLVFREIGGVTAASEFSATDIETVENDAGIIDKIRGPRSKRSATPDAYGSSAANARLWQDRVDAIKAALAG